MALKVLIVEDSEAERHALRRLLETSQVFSDYRLDVVEAADGEEGLARFVEHLPEVLLVDLLLPEVDGLTLSRQVRAHRLGAERPIIAMSGVYKEAKVVEQLAAEGIDLFAKPLDHAALERKLAATLEQLKRADASARERWATHSSPVADPPAKAEVADPVRKKDMSELSEDLGRYDFNTAIKGQFEQISLGGLLIQAQEARATGTLKIQRGKVKKAIFVLDGRPIFVDSNLRNETLGSYLVSVGKLQEGDLNEALKQARARKAKLGTVLVSLGFSDERTIQAGLKAQTRIKIVSALRWTDGLFLFEPGDAFRAKVPAFPVDVVQLVLLTHARVAQGEDLAAVFADKGAHEVQLTARGRIQLAAIRTAFGDPLFAQEGLTLTEFQERQEDKATALSRLQALIDVQLVQLVEPPAESELAASSTEQPPSVGTAEGNGPLELRHLAPAESPSQPAVPVIDLGEGRDWGEDSGVLEVPPTTRLGDPRASRLGSDLDQAAEDVQVREFFQDSQVRPAPTPLPPAQGEDAPQGPNPFASTSGDSAGLDATGPKVGGAAASFDPLQRHDYEARLGNAQVQEPVASDTFGAELFFQEGQSLLRNGDAAGAIGAFENAVAANAAQPDYHAQLGWAHFLRGGRGEGGARAARPHLARALAMASDAIRAHELAGRIEKDAGQLSTAADHFSAALRYGPPRADLFAALKEVLVSLEDWVRLENHYRTMIMRLREADAQQTLPYWIELAYLYCNQLDKPEDAEVALKVATRLAPDDPRVQAAAASISQTEAPWQEVAEGHRQRFAANPEDCGPLHDLFALHGTGQREADQLVVAGILESRGEAERAERLLLARLRPNTPHPAERPLAANVLDGLRHPADDRCTEAVLAALTDVLAEFFPIPPQQLGIAPGAELEADDLPGPLAEACHHVARLLGLPLPAFTLSRSALPMAALPGRNACIAVSELLLSQTDKRLLTFVASRAISCSAVGRREVFLRRGGDLKTAFLGTISCCRSGFRAADPDGQVAAFAQCLQNNPGAMNAVATPLDQLFASGSKFNLSEWLRGVRRTSARLGFLLCSDIITALKALESEPATQRDLTDFSLSAFYRWAVAEI